MDLLALPLGPRYANHCFSVRNLFSRVEEYMSCIVTHFVLNSLRFYKHRGRNVKVKMPVA